MTTPETLFGRPRIAGTRIGVDFLLDLLASGWTSTQILEQYPQVTPTALHALFAFARDCLKEEAVKVKAKASQGAARP